jgi:hypothetical protein
MRSPSENARFIERTAKTRLGAAETICAAAMGTKLAQATRHSGFSLKYSRSAISRG